MRALHVSHLQVLAWGWMPIALWGLHRFLIDPARFADGALTRFDNRARDLRLRVHRSGILEQLFSASPRARFRVRRCLRARVTFGARRDSLPRARPSRSGVGAHSCLRWRRGVGVRVGPSSVRIPKAAPTTGRCSAPTLAPTCRPLTTRISGEPFCTATSFPNVSSFQVS